MNANNNHTLSTNANSLPTSNTSSASFHNFLPTLQNQPSSALHTPSSSSHMYFPVPSFQQQDEYLHSNEHQIQKLSTDEWSLIMSLRFMKNLSVSPPFQPPSFLSYKQADSAASYQAMPSYQSIHQLQPPTYYATTSPHYYYSCTPSTAVTQQLLSAQEVPYSTTQAPTSLKTFVPSSFTPSATVDPPSPSIDSFLPSSTIVDSSLPPSITTSHLPLPPTTISKQEELAPTPPPPPAQSDHQSNSSESQIQSPSFLSLTSTSANNISQLQQRKSPAQHLLAPDPHSSINVQSLTTYEYDPLIAGPIVQLIDPTKPYKFGDTIKVGGRTLKSDVSSIKYWVEEDITITGTANGGHILHMGGYSYFAKHYGKNFTTWECEHRRHHRCSSIVIRSSDPTQKHYFRINSIQGEHIHESTPDNIEIRRFKQRVRDRCHHELSSPRMIYEDELMKGKYSAEMKAVLPTFYNMRK